MTTLDALKAVVTDFASVIDCDTVEWSCMHVRLRAELCLSVRGQVLEQCVWGQVKVKMNCGKLLQWNKLSGQLYKSSAQKYYLEMALGHISWEISQNRGNLVILTRICLKCRCWKVNHMDDAWRSRNSKRCGRSSKSMAPLPLGEFLVCHKWWHHGQQPIFICSTQL